MTTATRLRATGGTRFLPSLLSGLTLWFDAGQLTGLADAAAVATWPDSSGAGRNLTQSTAGNRPTYETNEPNGKPVVRFDGVDDWMITASYAGSALFSADAATITLVMKQDGAQATNALIAWIGPDGTNKVGSYLTYADVLYFDYGDVNTGGQPGRISGAQPGGWDNAWHVVTLRRSTTAGNIYVDGTSVVSGTFSDDLNTAASAAFNLGAAAGDHADPFKGDLAEVVVYNRALTTPERQQLEQSLGAKYGISVP